MVLKDMKIALIAGESMIPAKLNTPAAKGIANRL